MIPIKDPMHNKNVTFQTLDEGCSFFMLVAYPCYIFSLGLTLISQIKYFVGKVKHLNHNGNCSGKFYNWTDVNAKVGSRTGVGMCVNYSALQCEVSVLLSIKNYRDYELFIPGTMCNKVTKVNKSKWTNLLDI